ncbi:MAG: cell division protein [Streptococcus salivarius]
MAEEKSRIFEKKETEDSEEFANGKVVHSQEATSNESQPPVKKKVKKKKRPKGRNEKKVIQLVIFQLHNKILQD